MCKTISRLIVIAFLVTLVFGRCQAADTFDESLARAVDKFEKKRESERSKIVKKIDGKIRQIDRLQFDANAKVNRRLELTKAKERFERSGYFPADGSLLDLQFNYYKALADNFKPIHKIYESEIETAFRSGKDSAAERLVKSKAELEQRLLDVVPLTGNAVWRGTLLRSNGETIAYELHIAKSSATGSFAGVVEDNAGVGGHWRYEVEGQRTGINVQFDLTKSLRGKFVRVQAVGYIVGNIMIAQLSQLDSKRRSSIARIQLQQ